MLSHFKTLPTESKTRRVRILKDDDGHAYLVPDELELAFYHWVSTEGEEEMPDMFERLNSHLSCYTFTDPQYTPEAPSGR